MALMVHVPPEQKESTDVRRPRRRWRDKFRDALRGLRRGIRGHSSFFVHFFAAAIVILAAFAFHCHLDEWCVLIGCIGAVFTAELFNSAIETLIRGLEPAERERVKPVLDIAAGAVLMASITAAAIGGLIFGARLLDVLGW
jgi:diacylglycerol kinase